MAIIPQVDDAPEPQEPQQPTAPPLTPTVQQEPQGPTLRELLARDRERVEQTREQALFSVYSVALKSDPDAYAEAKGIASHLGVDPNTVESNRDVFRELSRQRALRERRLTEANPVLASRMVDIEFAKVAHDSVEQLSIGEQLSRQYEAGQLENELGRLGSRWRRQQATQQDFDRMAQIDARLKKIGPSDGFLGGSARIVGQMSTTLPQAVETGLSTSLLFGGTAGALGQMGPQIALPEEAATVPAAMVTGFTTGFLARVGQQTAEIESGTAYREMVRAGYDPQAAQWASFGVGLVNGALEIVPTAVIGKPFKDALFGEVRRKAIESLARPAAGQVVKRVALQYASGVGSEVATEVLQEVSSIVGEELARRATTNRTDLDPASLSEITDRLAGIAVQTAQGMALLGGFGPALTLHQGMQQVERAEATQRFFQRLTQNATDTPLRERAPGAYESFIESTTQGTPAETVYMDGNQFAETLRQSGVEREQLQQVLPEVAAQLDDAVRSGGDITLPTAAYAARLAGTPLGEAMLPHMRTDPDGVSAFQAQQMRAELQQKVADADRLLGEAAATDRPFYESSSRVAESMRAQLIATGRFKDREARTAAKLYQAFVDTQAERASMLPEEFERRHMLRVVAEGQDPATMKADPLRDGPASAAPLRSGDRGRFDPKRFVATLLERSDTNQGADASTFLHEAAHYFLAAYAEMAAGSNATEATRNDMKTLLAWFGVPDLAAWQAMTLEQQRQHHEAFASSFETYLFEGKAPSLELQSVFQRFVSWLRRVYRSLREINATFKREHGTDLPAMSEEVRGVFDRMIASDDAIERAAAVRGMASKIQGKDAAEQQTIDNLQGEARTQAVDELTRAQLRQMRFLKGSRGRLLRAMQAEAEPLREGIRAEVEEELRKSPIERARRWLRRGELLDEDGNTQQGERDENHKLDTDTVNELVPGAAEKLRGMTRKGALAPDVVAAQFGFASGRDLVAVLANAASFDEQVEAETTRRMTEEHAEFVPGTPEHAAAIDLALHNEARKRLLAERMRQYSRARPPVPALLAATREAAKQMLERMPLGEIHPSRFAAAAKRAGLQIEAALMKGDEGLAVEWMGKQLLQTELVGQAAAVREWIDAAMDRVALFARADEKLVKSRDIDYVRGGRALAAAYSIGPAIADAQERFVRESIEALAPLEPVLHTRLTALLSVPKHHRRVRLADFREVVEVADALWTLSHERYLLNAEARRTELRAAVGELTEQIGTLPVRKAPGSKSADLRTPTDTDRAVLKGWEILASLKRFEHWVRFMDGGKSDGPFRRYLYDPLRRATDGYAKAKREIVTRLHPRFMDVVEKSGAWWDARIAAPELGGFVFKGKKELLGALLHTGTESNLLKLLGDTKRRWGEVRDIDGEQVLDSSRWDRFVSRMFAEGVITKADIDYVRFHRGLFAELLPQAQQAHRKVYGFEFEALAVRDWATPFGVLEGGYVPARADADEMTAPRLASVEATMEGLERRVEFSVSTGKGFTIKRNPYFRQPLSLDLSKQIQHFDEELRFIYLQPVIKDALRLTRHRDFASSLGEYDRQAITSIIEPALENFALQTNTKPGKYRALDAAASFLTGAASVAALGFNVMNGLVQISGLGNARVEVPGKYHRAALAMFFRGPGNAKQEAARRSDYFARRIDTTEEAMQRQIARMADEPIARVYKATQQGAAFAAFALQRWVQGIVDTITWHGAYAHAIAEQGQTLADAELEAHAVAHADGVLRRTQGSNKAEDAAAYETGTPAGKLLVQFMSYSNLVLNQVLGQQAGQRSRAVAWAILAPALAEATMRLVLVGTPEDDDGDGKLDEIVATYARTATRNVTGLVPLVGPALAALAEGEGDRVLSSPAGAMLQAAVRGLYALDDAAVGELSGSEARALWTLLTMATRLPLTPIGRAVGYEKDVADGKKPAPTGPIDRARGVIIGR